MKTLIIPLVIILAPFIILFIGLRYLNKAKEIAVVLRIVLGLLFMALGIMATLFAMNMAMRELSEKGVRCMTGIVVFIPLSFIANIIGIPLLLFYYKDGRKVTSVN